MSSKRVVFSHKTIEALPTPSTTRQIYYDARMPYLGLRVSPQGTKVWVFYRKVDRVPVLRTIGRFPDLSVDEARKAAELISAELVSRTQPITPARVRQVTLADLWDRYLNDYARLHCRTWKNMDRTWRSYFTPLADCPALQIKRADVQRWHSQIGDQHGRTAANRALELLSAIYNKSIQWELLPDGCSPAQKISKFKLAPRERFLKPDELSRFFHAVKSLRSRVTADFILIALYTGARKSNVMAMRWEHVDLDRAVWYIPADQSKNRVSQYVPLTAEALEILRSRQSLCAGSPWVFPSDRHPGQHLRKVTTAWRYVLHRSGLNDLRVHDLRRTLASWQAMTGANLPVIAQTLNHKDFKATAIYARLMLDPVHSAMQTAVERMRQHAGA